MQRHDPEAIPAEIVRQSLAEGRCPWCGRCYKGMMQHIYPKHGVSTVELRDLALLLRRQPTCSLDLSAHMAEKRQAAMRAGRAHAPAPCLSYNGKKRQYTKAGLAINRRLFAQARARRWS